MKIVCLDLEGVLVPEIWIEFSKRTGIPELMRTTRDEERYKHLENSMKIAKMLEEKASRFDYALQKTYVERRDFESLEMYVMELLMRG